MLDEELLKLAKSKRYPFHMPGHKRRMEGLGDPYQIDITEIEGFDDLHDPRGMILKEEKALAEIYGADRSYLMVNGSTGGNLAAVFAATHPGDTIIMGRNSHKSVYHAAELQHLCTVYAYPEISKEGMVLGIGKEEYQRVILEHPEATAVVLTSPTYEGRIEPLAEITALAHERGMAVIVDAAHGAHLGWDPYFPASPLDSGADLVVMSLHKTLPALTQTAVLHYQKNPKDPQASEILKKRVEKYLVRFQTSSPSYVLMASMSRCIRFLEEERDAFAAYAERLQEFYRWCEDLERFNVRAEEGQDPSKVVIYAGSTGLLGGEIQKRLCQESLLDLEMSSFSYCLAMTSVMDTTEGLQRLFHALQTLEKDSQSEEKEVIRPFWEGRVRPGESAMQLWEAADRPWKILPLEESIGLVAAEEVSLYPPGIPILVPGERIQKENIELLNLAKDSGLKITGLFQESTEGISVVI